MDASGIVLVTQFFIDLLCVLAVLQRPIPLSVAGELLSYHYEPDSRRFTCTWRESAGIDAPTVIYMPAHSFGSNPKITLTPEGPEHKKTAVADGSPNQHIIIAPTGKADERTLTIQ